ncbi:hypothetical protein FHT13_001431 [Xanthomonas arboricola]|nr:hypothetical protein [Xanthomonas arboricola]
MVVMQQFAGLGGMVLGGMQALHVARDASGDGAWRLLSVGVKTENAHPVIEI